MSYARRSIVGGISLSLLWLLSTSAQSKGDRVFRGELADSQCAANVHSLDRSHKEMLKVKSVGTTSADCTNFCVKQRGGKFVLQIKDKMYRLDKQELVQEFAGHKVRVTGTLGPEPDTIHVRKIEALP